MFLVLLTLLATPGMPISLRSKTLRPWDDRTLATPFALIARFALFSSYLFSSSTFRSSVMYSEEIDNGEPV
jgi:hypothetical protein